MKNKAYFTLIPIVLIAFAGCKKDDPAPSTPPPPVNEEEVLTSIILTFTDTLQNDQYILSSRDLDGDGGQPPLIQGDTLPIDRYFNVSVQVLNESVSPPIDITGEIQDEGEEHQFFFQHPGINISLSNFDVDANGRPIGTAFTAQTFAPPSSGELKVILRHDPDKDAPGVAQGDITNAGGDTDIEVLLPLVIL